MLFVFESGKASSFWMKGMRFALDFVWISSGCEVVGVTVDVPPPASNSANSTLPTYSSPSPAAYVFEINAGEVAAHGIAAGDTVRFSGISVEACATVTPTATPPLPNAPVNPCSYRSAEPTPTPDLTTPTSTSFPNATPAASTPARPSADGVAYPDLPPPPLPASVEAWQDAVVRVIVELSGGRARNQQGLVVSDGAVLTVLDLTEEVASLSVKMPGRDAFAAELERFDTRTGAALLSVGAEDLSVAPSTRATIAPGEPVLLLSRDPDSGELLVEETFASPSLNAPNHILALLPDYTPRTQPGTVVLADGTPVGLAGHSRRWYGQRVVLGRFGGTGLPVVLLDSAFRLLEFAPLDASITPAAVVYRGPGRGRHVDGPLTREILAQPVQETLKELGEPVPLENLGRHPRYVLRSNSGAMLELLYAKPQKLRGADGGLLGSASYVVLWWSREGGAPDLVLCGTDRLYLGAAFATHGLGSFEALMEGVPSSSPHSVVAAAPLPVPEDVDNPEDYQYPYVWELKPDKSSYLPDELVTLTFKINNISDWPVPLAYMPPRVTIYSIQEHRDVAVLHYGDSHRILQPKETASFSIAWDQGHFESGQAAPGRYIARVQLANLAPNPLLDWGPQADLILE